jgi:hypothetical protein
MAPKEIRHMGTFTRSFSAVLAAALLLAAKESRATSLTFDTAFLNPLETYSLDMVLVDGDDVATANPSLTPDIPSLLPLSFDSAGPTLDQFAIVTTVGEPEPWLLLATGVAALVVVRISRRRPARTRRRIR